MFRHICSPTNLFLILCICACFMLPNSVYAQSNTIELKPKQIKKERLKGGEIHFYKFYAKQGNCVYFVVEQKGIDVVSTIKNEQDEKVKDVDRPSGSFGRETVTFIAPQTGFYTIEISTWLEFVPAGIYEIRYSLIDFPDSTFKQRNIAENLTSEGETLRGSGKAERKREAIKKFSEALVIWQDLDDKYEQAVIYYGLGFTHQSLSEYTESAIFYNRALMIMSDLGDEFGTALNYRSLASVQYILNENELSIYHFKKAIEIYLKLKLDRDLGISYAGLGAVQIINQQYDEAIVNLNESLKLRELINDDVGKAKTLLSLVKLYLHTNQFVQAENTLLLALETWNKTNQPKEAEIYFFFGRLYLKTGRYEKALESLQTALESSRMTGNKLGEANVLLEISRVELRQEKLESSLQKAQTSINLIESLRSSTLDFRKRMKFSETIQPFYENYILLLMSLHKKDSTRGFDEIALQISEQARFRILLDQMERRRLIREGKIDANLLDQEQILREELLNVLSLNNNKDKYNAQIQEISAELLEVELKINQFSQTFENVNFPKIITPPEIQNKLDNNTILLEYALIDEESFLWLVTNKEIKTYKLPPAKKINTNAREVYECISKPIKLSPNCRKKLDTLSKFLLPMKANELHGKKLVVIKHGFLQYIPFSTLSIPQKTSNVKLNSQKFLIETNEIVSLPSASLMNFISESKNEKPQKKIAVFADPIYSPMDIRIEKPNNSQDKTKQYLPRLFASRFEANEISKFASPQNLLMKMDADANVDSVINADLKNFEIIHFATHTLLNDQQPELSAIALSLFDQKGNASKGFIRSNDILTLDLSANLVVLSSCQSGLGKQIKGEGLTSLSHSFYVAGSNRLLVSLWNVNDKVTADFMIKLYQKHFQENKGFSTALRETQIETLEDKRWNSPFYWSAFTLQGDWN